MCRYYAHTYICRHVTHSFAAFCEPAGLIQTRCGERTIWQTIRIDNEYCDDCKAFFSSPSVTDWSVRRTT